MPGDLSVIASDKICLVSPASHPAFAAMCLGSKDVAKMDRAYVVFPAMENRKSANDNPSHRVLKFLTGSTH